MKQLSDILYKVKLEEVSGGTGIAIKGIAIDSRLVEKGFLFAAIPGTQVDGHSFIDTAIEKGASSILCSRIPEKPLSGITYLKVEKPAVAVGIAADNFYDNPSSQLELVAVTGTNGKTTVATLLYNLFENLGYKCGLISTVEIKIHNKTIPATHTTPDVINLHKLLDSMARDGCAYCFMETSSHSIDQDRIAGLDFAGAIFTNITHDHLDYHKTFQAYIKAKKKLFDQLPKKAFALVNTDDKNGKVLLQNTQAVKKTYGMKKAADFKVKVLENSFDGLILEMDGEEMHSQLVGSFNAYNLLAVYGTASLLKSEKIETLRELSVVSPAEGRFNYFLSDKGIAGIIDYAHTPDALINVLKTIRAITTGNENLITVVGCGGDRDRTKRPLMGEAAARLSDKVIFTADNPRSENPGNIINEMKEGVLPPFNRKVIAITDRKEAILTAVHLAVKGDIILVAGKGHEKYQDINGVKKPFDDKAELINAIKTMEA